MFRNQVWKGVYCMLKRFLKTKCTSEKKIKETYGKKKTISYQ